MLGRSKEREHIFSYGFILPSNGDIIDLEVGENAGLTPNEYCRNYVWFHSSQNLIMAFEKFLSKLYPKGAEENTLDHAYVEFCVRVLNWSKVGNAYDRTWKIITCTDAFDSRHLREKYPEYDFDIVVSIPLSSLQ